MSESMKIRTGFDRELVWHEGGSYRYLVVEAEAPALERPASDRPPLHLALVIDCSGSMNGPRLDAAKVAAIGVAERLRPEDHLSVVTFAEDAQLVCERLAMNPSGKEGVVESLGALQTRGMTDLCGGWLMGAECLARGMQTSAEHQSRLIVLSDGKANEGLTDPDELSVHAEELRRRGIVTSVVGIGDDYSTAQLHAIAESGGGNVHDAERPDEIIEMVMGELGEAMESFAEELVLEIDAPAAVELECWNRFPLSRSDGRWMCSLGTLPASALRRAVFLVRTPHGEIGDSLLFGVTARWRAPGEDAARHTAPVALSLGFASEDWNLRQRRDIPRSVEVARVWQARLVREATHLNRMGDFDGVRDLLQRELPHFERYCHELPGGHSFLREMEHLRRHAQRPMHERTRKNLNWTAYQTTKGTTDHRSRRRGTLGDHLSE